MYSRITPSRNGRDALLYARGGKNRLGHNRAKHRNLLIGGVNLLPDEVMPYEDQMEKYWRRATPRHEIQVRRIIVSFSKKELDPHDPNSPLKALQIATEFAEKYYPNRQSAIFIQNDGKGGCLHFHLIVNDCDIPDGKGCSIEQQKYYYVEKHVDEVAKNLIQLDTDRRNIKNKETYHERGIRSEDRYVWKDDLKQRIREAMDTAETRDDFVKLLSENGVEASFKTSKKQGDYILYELKDLSIFEGELPDKSTYFRSKSYKLGSDFGIDALDRSITRNHSRKSVSGLEKDRSSAKESEPKKAPAFDSDEVMQARFNLMIGINYDIDNFKDKKQESDRRWKEFKDRYPDGYKDRLDRKDITIEEPKESNISSTDKPIKSDIITIPAAKQHVSKQNLIDELLKEGEDYMKGINEDKENDCNDVFNKKT